MAALSGAYFLMKCKGVLYPCNYDAIFDENHLELSLSEMCSDVIVSDSGFTKQVLAHIPTQLYYLLMKRAINQGYHQTICFLISKWPFRVLSLGELWPLFTSVRNVYDNKRRNEMIKNAAAVTTVMINAFLHTCKSDGALKILDLRGFPIIDRTLRNLSAVIQTLTTEEPTKLENQFHIFLDCTIRDDDTCHELISAISTQKHNQLTLHISKIDVSCLGEPLLANLLSKLQPKELYGISLQYNSLGNDGFAAIQPIIANFRSVTAFDVSCNNLQLPRNMAIFNRLQRIERLDMSNNRLGSCLLHILPAAALRKLKYLKLSACLLKRTDLIHLRSSFGAESILCELDLSENSILSRNDDLLSSLLDSVSDLRILEIEDCEFTSENLNFLVKCLSKLKKLEFVNLARHEFTSSCLLDNLPRLGSLPSLKCVRVSFPRDCYELDQDGGTFEEHRKKLMARKLYDEMNKWRDDKIEIMWTEFIIY